MQSMAGLHPTAWPVGIPHKSLRAFSDAVATLGGGPLVTPRSLWLYRGQSRASWHLTPSIERKRYSNTVRESESQMIADFRAHAPLGCKDVPGFDDRASWLSLMRHHGVPTRLLDWTYSPMVALFFAFEDRDPDMEKDAAVWAVNATLIRKEVEGLAPKIITDFHAPLDLSSATHFDAMAFYAFDGLDASDALDARHRRELGLVAHLLPRKPNTRLAAQQGSFLISCNHCLPFQDSLKNMMRGISEEKWIRKWVFPYSLRIQILEQLYRSNIHPLSLFPDLDGLGRLVALKGEVYPSGTFE